MNAEVTRAHTPPIAYRTHSNTLQRLQVATGLSENPLDGDEWETVTDATKFDQPYVKARSPAQGAPALRPEQMDNLCPNSFHGRLAHVVRDLLELHFGVECSACDLHGLLMSRYRSEWGQYHKPEIIVHRRLCSCYRASCWEITRGRSSQKDQGRAQFVKRLELSQT
jgi:hypothetical protein